MARIIIYTKINCSYCTWAKDFFNNKDLAFKEINLTENPELLEKMLEKSNGHRSVPQIFINENHIGGYDDLMSLNKAGELDTILKSSPEHN